MRPRIITEDLATCGYPPTSSMPSTVPEYMRQAERTKLYASQGEDGKIWLITNPAAWERIPDRPVGYDLAVRPRPIRLGNVPVETPKPEPKQKQLPGVVRDLQDRFANMKGF